MKKKSLLVMGALLAPLILSANSIDYTKGLSIWFDTPTHLSGKSVWLKGDGYGSQNLDQEWESKSLPIGNGSLGANIMGSIETERITLNEKTLWRGGPNNAKGADYYWNVNKKSAHLLKDIRKAFADGDNEKAAQLTKENFNGLASYEESEETPFRFGSFSTLGELQIDTDIHKDEIKDYRRILNIDSALAVVEFNKGNVHYERSSFISFPDNIMVIKFLSSSKGKQNLTFSYSPSNAAIGSIQPIGAKGLLYSGELKDNKMKFAVRIQAINKGGSLDIKNGKFVIKDADEVVFLLSADTDYKMNFNPDFNDPKTYVGVNPLKTTEQTITNALSKGYDQLLENHKEDYCQLFNRVQLKLNPSVTNSNIPTYKRLENYRKGIPDYHLEELYYQYGRYLLIASSRKGNMPANLQGIWHNNVDGPWHMDYHNNINIQMNYWPACSTNLTECAWPMIDFIRSLVKSGKITAKDYFGARGWTASISANIFGLASPLTSQMMEWNFNPMAGPWLATHIWEYYDYTRDKKFLKDIGYDLIKSSAQFSVDYLWNKPDGSYTAAPSTSPEHGPIDQGATFVHAVIREILLDAINASKVLNVDSKERLEWQKVLIKLSPYKIGRYGQLMEWSTDIDDPKDQHRHVNHLFGLHPGHTISPITTPKLAEASKVVLNHRGDGATGWSMGWKLNQWARLHDGNHAYILYGNLLKNGTMDNLWDTHPPFQIDGNFGGTAGVTEMLLQSHMNFVHLLPSLPDAWKDGSIKGLCTKGNFEVSIFWKNNKLTRVDIISHAGQRLTLKYSNNLLSMNTIKGKSYSFTLNKGKLVQI